MIIYVDENISHYLAEGLNILQIPLNYQSKEPIEVKSIAKEFGRGARDEDWIPLAGKSKSCVLTQDYNIQRIRHQRELCIQYELGMFYFRPPSKGGFQYWQLVELIIKHWPEIIRLIRKKERPFAFKCSMRASKLEEME